MGNQAGYGIITKSSTGGGGGGGNPVKTISWTTTGVGVYVFDGTVISYNPTGKDFRGLDVAQFFLAPALVDPADYTWNSAAGSLIFGDIGDIAASLNVYKP